MQDRPDARELLEAVRGFLEEQVVPVLDGTRQFHARVAVNVLRIVARELELGDASLRLEWRRLADLLDEPTAEEPGDAAALRTAVHTLNATLAERIRAGDADREPWRRRVVAYLRASADDRLAIANPRYRDGPIGE